MVISCTTQEEWNIVLSNYTNKKKIYDFNWKEYRESSCLEIYTDIEYYGESKDFEKDNIISFSEWQQLESYNIVEETNDDLSYMIKFLKGIGIT